MHALALSLLLAAACLHVTWNLLIKRAAARDVVTWWAIVAGSVLFLPVLLAAEPLPAAVGRLAVASAAVEAVYYVLLAYAYGQGDFSQVYPIARGTAPVLLAVWSALLLREYPSVWGACGIIGIVLGLVDSEPRRMNALGRSIHSSQADVANVQILFDSGTMATITASRATEEKIRTLSITQPDAYIVLNYADQDIQIHRRAAQEYTLNRESIRYRQASFVERLFVHKDNPLKLEIRHLLSAARAAKASGQVELAETEDLRSLAVALEIERMFREGRGEIAWPKDLPWSAASR